MRIAALVLGLAACGPPRAEPAPGTLTPPPPAVAAAIDAGAVATVAVPVDAAPPDPGPTYAVGGPAVLLRSIGEPPRLVAVACADAAGALGDRDCIPLVADAVLLDGRSVAVRRRAGVRECASSWDPPAPAVSVAAANVPEDTLGLWPADHAPPDPVARDARDFEPTAAELAAVRDTMAADYLGNSEGSDRKHRQKQVTYWLEGDDALTITQTLRRRLDADADPDRVVVVEWDLKSSGYKYGVLIWRGDATTPELLHTSAYYHSRLRILATIDLDGDGVHEIVTVEDKTSSGRWLSLLASTPQRSAIATSTCGIEPDEEDPGCGERGCDD